MQILICPNQMLHKLHFPTNCSGGDLNESVSLTHLHIFASIPCCVFRRHKHAILRWTYRIPRRIDNMTGTVSYTLKKAGTCRLCVFKDLSQSKRLAHSEKHWGYAHPASVNIINPSAPAGTCWAKHPTLDKQPLQSCVSHSPHNSIPNQQIGAC